ncbi:protein kinase domain-containing protein [Cellulomonas soli]|uniref:non-specific serine/threonine protein kinase n=1 Tax=Cellulomonas soli TaxID=931535 RepID=A0A512P9C8_9CELL|nr:PASTA domain-containing protein [Cellulomonas soli]NYI60292.1 serine/threonine-protein kinase [Cellulomonas soli]GEP67803.1 hypothetical protein CSO01_05180 [Cellulomonas soli]
MTGFDEGGTLLGGRYLLGDLLGVGGSASVFEADDLRSPEALRGASPERVAVKVLHPHLSAHEGACEAFLREARAAQSLDHPGIAAVHASGAEDIGGIRTAWIALDLVTGGSLADRVARTGPMGVAEAAAVLDGVLGALGAAHRAGLVHRDVSPANVLLQQVDPDEPLRAEQVRVVDLGLADATGSTAVGADLLRTPAGGAADPGERGVIGNAHYMSPEQAQGRPVRAAGDLYQAGALLYFLLTGRPPYPLPSADQVLQAHVSAPQPVPSALEPGARVLDRVVVHAMAKTPARRYRDAEEFRAAVRAAVGPDRAETRAPGQRPATRDLDPSGAVSSEGAAGQEVRATQVLRGATRPGEPVGADLDYLDPVGPPATSPVTAGPPSPAGGAVLGVAVAAVLGIALWGALTAAADPGAPSPQISTSTSAAADPAPTTEAPVVPPSVPSPATTTDAEPTPTTDPVRITVPTLYGTLSDSLQALRDAGLQLGAVTRADSAEAADKVLGQAPAAGEAVDAGSTVEVTLASGFNAVPEVTGTTVANATASLQDAGFTVAVSGPAPGVDASGTDLIVGTRPVGGSRLRVGATVTLVVAAAVPTPSPDPSPVLGDGA